MAIQRGRCPADIYPGTPPPLPTAIPIHGERFAVEGHPRVTIGEETASLLIASDNHIVARVRKGR